jgi:hypothetical protein
MMRASHARVVVLSSSQIPPRLRRTIPPPSADDRSLPRFDLPSEQPLDSSEVLATSKRPSMSTIRPYRPVRRRADSTADVAVEDILLEAYIEPPPQTRRSPRGPPPPPRENAVEVFELGPVPALVTRFVPPPRASEQAAVDALLSRHVDIPIDVEVPSIAPVAMPTPAYPTLFPPVLPTYGPPPETKRSYAGAIAAGLLIAMTIGVGAAAGAFFGPRAWARLHPPPRVETPVAAAPLPVPPPPSTVVTVPPPPADTQTQAPPPVDPTTTLVTLPPYAKGHRVFFDGVLVSSDTSSPVKLKCGRHVLRIGLHGRVRGVNLPCGGETTLK